MSEHSRKTKATAQPTPLSGKANTDAVREGLAMVMDGLRVMATGGATVTRPYPFQDGRLLLPALEFHDHKIGAVMDEHGVFTFTLDGVSVMDGGHGQEEKA